MNSRWNCPAVWRRARVWRAACIRSTPANWSVSPGRRPNFYHARAMKVVVPEQGLVRLTQRLLGGLSVGDVSAETFDSWIVDQGRHMLKGLPKRVYDYTAPAVIYIKRHPVMFAVVD